MFQLLTMHFFVLSFFYPNTWNTNGMHGTLFPLSWTILENGWQVLRKAEQKEKQSGSWGVYWSIIPGSQSAISKLLSFEIKICVWFIFFFFYFGFSDITFKLRIWNSTRKCSIIRAVKCPCFTLYTIRLLHLEPHVHWI